MSQKCLAYEKFWTFVLEIPWNFYFFWTLVVTYFRYNILYLFQKGFLCKCSIFVSSFNHDFPTDIFSFLLHLIVINLLLTHLFLMHPSSTPWKHQKTDVFLMFLEGGVEKGCIGKKWVNQGLKSQTQIRI